MLSNPDKAERRPTVTGCVLTRNSESRLQQVLNLLGSFCDEVVVGVDEASDDRTLAIACSNADKVFCFRHGGSLAAARMLPFQYATSDWLFSIDDDESLEVGFGQILRSLLDMPITHAWFMRKWIVSESPPRFLSEEHWFPDWQLRLFRNDSSLVRKPAVPHSGYWVVGPSHRDERAAILHFEPILITEHQRAEKLENYLKKGAHPNSAIQYSPSNRERDESDTPLPAPIHETKVKRRLIQDVELHDVSIANPVGWRCEFVQILHKNEVAVGQRVFVEIEVRNAGTLSWMPPNVHRPTIIGISFHLLYLDGSMAKYDNGRLYVDRLVRPGEVLKMYSWLDAFPTSGEFVLDWDMVCEGECWFSQCQSHTKHTKLNVRLNEVELQQSK